MLHVRFLVGAVLVAVLSACGNAGVPAASNASQPVQVTLAKETYQGIPTGTTAEGYHVLGQADAPITLESYSDFLCTTCRFHILQTEPTLIQDYVATGKAKIIYRHLLQLGDRTERVAIASECAADQGLFWAARETFYQQQSELYSSSDLDTTLADMVAGVGGDSAAMQRCLSANTHQEEVRADADAARAAGVTSRPVFQIGTTRLVGPQSVETFARAIGA